MSTHRILSGHLEGVAPERLERLRKNFYHLWRVVRELEEAEEPEALLASWRSAPQGSQEWRKALFYEGAMKILRV